MRARMVIVAMLVLFCWSSMAFAQYPYEAYYLYLGDHPDEEELDWSEEAQGLTHDDNNWFITQKEALWKIPVNQNLAAPDPPGTGGVERIFLADVPALANEGYNHFGGLSYYNYQGQGFLLVAVEVVPGPPQKPGVAVFKADALEFLDYQRFWAQSNNGPYVAVDPQGVLYSSNGEASKINRYRFNWGRLSTEGRLDPLIELTPLTLYNEQGNVLSLKGIQGGVISPGGELLYLVAEDTSDPAADGIQVLEVSTGKRVQYSKNGSGHFNFEFDPSCSFPDWVCEEPEGITIWDLDDGRAPGISGQLHVMLLDNDAPDGDDIYLKHYTGTIYVDGAYTDDEQGTPAQPFNTVTEAYNLSWDRAQIKIKAGAYAEPLIFSKRTRLLADGGVVRIGQ